MDDTLQMLTDMVIATDLVATFTNGRKYGYLIRVEGVGLVRHTECTFGSELDATVAGLKDYESLNTTEAIVAALGTLTVMDGGMPVRGRGVEVTHVFTGAPKAADYDTTFEVETFECAACPGATPKAWRKVAIVNDAYRTAYQCDRYGSFLGGCPTLDDPRRHPIGTGRPAPTNFGRHY